MPAHGLDAVRTARKVKKTAVGKKRIAAHSRYVNKKVAVRKDLCNINSRLTVALLCFWFTIHVTLATGRL